MMTSSAAEDLKPAATKPFRNALRTFHEDFLSLTLDGEFSFLLGRRFNLDIRFVQFNAGTSIQGDFLAQFKCDR